MSARREGGLAFDTRKSVSSDERHCKNKSFRIFTAENLRTGRRPVASNGSSSGFNPAGPMVQDTSRCADRSSTFGNLAGSLTIRRCGVNRASALARIEMKDYMLPRLVDLDGAIKAWRVRLVRRTLHQRLINTADQHLRRRSEADVVGMRLSQPPHIRSLPFFGALGVA